MVAVSVSPTQTSNPDLYSDSNSINETIIPSSTFIASSTEPKSNGSATSYSKIIGSPKTISKYIYYLLGMAISISLFFALFVKFEHQKLEPILHGALTLSVIAAMLIINSYFGITQIIIG